MTRLLQDDIAHQAALRPNAPAVVLDDSTVSYGELERTANQLAQALAESGCRRGDRVCLFLPKTPAAVAAMLGVLKADCVYVPIDLSSPPARVARIVAACEPRGMLVAGGQTPGAPARLLDDVLAQMEPAERIYGTLDGAPVRGEHFATSFDGSHVGALSELPPACRNTPDDPAHILFTSGSTGVPKGVVIPHRTVAAFVDWGRDYFAIRPGDACSGHAPLHFDLSTFDIYGTLSAGGVLHMVPPQANVLPGKLADFIRRSELVQWFSVPSVLTYLVQQDAIRPGDFPALKRLLWCGEVLPTPTLLRLMERLPHVQFTNLYGPTEATIASSYYTVLQPPADVRDEIPIGTACPGEELLVLDEKLHELPAGDIGELYIRGAGLSLGYWRDEEKTAAAFLADPRDPRARIYKTGDLARRGEDGQFYFLGRADSQIKSRGYRIELGEVEAAFHALNCLADCAIVGVPTGGFEGTAICCAFVPQPNENVTPARLRGEVAKLLPAYMLPLRYQAFERLPKNGNGKVDRPRLRAEFAEQLQRELAGCAAS